MSILPQIETDIYEDLQIVQQPKAKITVNFNFVKSAFAEVLSNNKGEFKVEFKNGDETLYETVIKDNCWSKCLIQYFIPYTIKITDLSDGEIIFNETLNLKGKKVVVEFGSKSLGDTLAWMPYVDEFQRKHECDLHLITFKNYLFTDQYPNITFHEPGTSFSGVNAWYEIGWFYDGENINRFKHPNEVKTQPMQKTASDILGLEYKEIKPRLSFTPAERPITQSYVTIAIHSTAQLKYWNGAEKWDTLVNYLREQGYEVVLLSEEKDGYMGNSNPRDVKYPDNYELKTIMNYLHHSDFFIGLGSGLTWLSWALNTPTVLISGFSEPYTEMKEGIIRIGTPEGFCTGCFNTDKLNAGLWSFCPRHQNDDARRFECTTSISPDLIIEKILPFIINNKIKENNVY